MLIWSKKLWKTRVIVLKVVVKFIRYKSIKQVLQFEKVQNDLKCQAKNTQKQMPGGVL